MRPTVYILLLLGFAITIITIAFLTAHRDCLTYEEMTGLYTQYRYSSGCYAYVPDQGWRHTNDIKIIINP